MLINAQSNVLLKDSICTKIFNKTRVPTVGTTMSTRLKKQAAIFCSFACVGCFCDGNVWLMGGAEERTPPQQRLLRQYLAQRSVVGLLLDPTAWWAPNEHFTGLIIAEDDEREGHWDQPPAPLEWVHTQHSIGTRHVGQKSSQQSFFEQTSDEDLK